MKKLLKIIIIVIILIFGYQLFSRPPSSPAYTDTNPLSISSTNNSNMDKLIIEDLKIGTGSEVKSGDNIVIHYRGTLTDGTQFDSSYDRGTPFETQIGVGQVIKGWDEGVIGMKVGGTRKLTIPPELGYGANGAGNVIPPNATLIFEVELVSVN